MTTSKTPPWQMSEEQRGLWPDISGDEINGLGERKLRRPTIVYWPNENMPNKYGEEPIPHGKVVKFMTNRSATTAPEIARTYTDFENRAPEVYDPISAEQRQDTPNNWTAKVKDFVRNHEGDLVGVSRFNPDWYFEEYDPPPDLPWVVVIGAHMDYEKMKQTPPTAENPTAAVEVGEVYNRIDRAAGRLADWIRHQGWYAEHQGGPDSGQMTMIPAALECGFGELGKHGSIINREYGSLIRLSVVRTDMPLVADQEDVFGVDDFCLRCQACSRACPADAIYDEKKWVRGEKKWYVNFDKCVPFFNENYGCAICIAVCPWSRPGAVPTLLEKIAKYERKRKP